MPRYPVGCSQRSGYTYKCRHRFSIFLSWSGRSLVGLGAALLRKVRVGARPLALRFSSNRGIAARPRFGQTLVWLAIGAFLSELHSISTAAAASTAVGWAGEISYVG